VRNNAPNRLTGDHTTAQTWIDHGIMTEEQAKERPEAHSLARALGEKARVEPDVRSLPLRMEKGDVLLLCSAGIHRYLEDDAMGSMVARLEPEHACQELCEVASTRSKSPDCKALVYQSGPLRPGNFPRLLQQRRLRRQRKYAGAGVGVVALIALLVGAFYFFGPTSGTPGEESRKKRPDVRVVSVAQVEDAVADGARIDLSSPEVTDTVGLAEVALTPDLNTERDMASDAASAASDVNVGAEAVAREITLARDSEIAEEPTVAAIQPQPIVHSDGKAPMIRTSSEPRWAPQPSKEARKRCQGADLERVDRRRARDLRHLVRNGLNFLKGSKKNASAAAKQAKAASKTLRNSSAVVRERCTDHVMDLRNTVKARYLHLAWVSSTRAMDNLDKKTSHCAKSFRMARDAQRLGATDEELREARRICGKE